MIRLAKPAIASVLVASALTAGAVVLAAAAPRQQQTTADFETATAKLQEQLDAALAELEQVRDQIEVEKLPLAKRLNELEAERIQVESEAQREVAKLDTEAQEVFNLKRDIEAFQKESDYLADLLAQYIRNFESGLHIAEMQLYEDVLDSAKDAAEDPSTELGDVFARQTEVVLASIERLHGAIGGRRFEGRAIDPSGIQEPGMFVVVGPMALFREASGEDIGTVEMPVGSFEPTIVPYTDPLDLEAADNFIASGTGSFPLDPTLGDAHKIASTEKTLLDEFEDGGMVMYPIVGMAALALLVALFKWLTLSSQRKPSRKKLQRLLDAIADGDEDTARARAASMPGPTGRMLAAGVEHLREPRELVEEVMYEQLLTAKLKLNKMLPFIAICAASAPLLGLLGTVTGIINTFKLITVFGSGDVRQLSGGISEALITTKFGLIVAIPSLLLHAFLSRKARGITGDMETAAVALTNQLTLTPFRRSRTQGTAEVPEGSAAPDPELVRAQVSEILGDLLGSGAGESKA